jgi:hypothetical protein
MSTLTWRICWSDRNSRWHPYEEVTPGTIDEMLQEIESDPTAIFGGGVDRTPLTSEVPEKLMDIMRAQT